MRWKDTKQRRSVEGYKGKEKCKRRTKKKNWSVYIFTKPAVVCFSITTKNKNSLLQEYNLFWVTVKDFSGNFTTKASKKPLNKHKIKDQSLLIILYNLVEFRITGLPNFFLFSCSLSLLVGNRIFLEEKMSSWWAEIQWCYYLHYHSCWLISLVIPGESLPRTSEIGQWHCDTGCRVSRAVLPSTRFALDIIESRRLPDRMESILRVWRWGKREMWMRAPLLK